MPARLQAATGPLSDQTGDPGAATVLALWVDDWRSYGAPGTVQPRPTVPDLATWLHNRFHWACDKHPAIDDFAHEIATLHHQLRAVLHLVKPRAELCQGVRCRQCDTMALYRTPGDDRIVCDNCPALYTHAEYAEWTGLLAAPLTAQTRRPA